MDERCKNCDEKQACVPYFVHEGIMTHYSRANRRMLIALISICVTMIIVVLVFATNQTKREQMWQETIKSMYSATAQEVDNGQQDADH